MSADYSYDIVFLALARNCADTIPGFVQGMERLRQAGIRVAAVVGENGSEDDTRELLEDAAAATGVVHVVDTSFMSGAASRLERMALGRQFVARFAKDMLLPARSICVIDVDEPFLENLQPDVLLSALQRVMDGDVFAVSATSRPTYYDLLAYEDGERSFADLGERIRNAQHNPFAYYSFFRKFVYPEQRRLTSDTDTLCRSAFNGLCLYSAGTYALGTYIPENGPWICEHITFNRSLASATGLQMVVDRALVVPMPSEHGRLTLVPFMWQRMRKLPEMFAMRLGKSG
ncbi:MULTISPECIES: glycosyltransferase family 2 protein [unclassified Arthrobacter]|uniref:glycosyltransferase family 2 protein n=1 Tax=unclassified Arthrobacter TaxID=235627 RepID=UPI00148689B5|nr:MULTISPECIES: glycosyltransferase family 2 protein [unclassified Arthrobacter]